MIENLHERRLYHDCSLLSGKRACSLHDKKILSLYISTGIPKGQYKGYTCPRCQKAKVSAQHLRQKEKKKKSSSVSSEKSQPSKDISGGLEPVKASAKKQSVLSVKVLLEAILADSNSDPTALQPLKNSFKKLLQIQRAFKVR